MTYGGINPNSLSNATKEICYQVLGIDSFAPKATQERLDRTLTPAAVAKVFNLIDPELTGLSEALEEKLNKQKDD
jgi:hypothetical protein